MAVLDVSQSDFEEKTKEGVTLVDFWAPWCGPCRALTPVIEELDQEMGDKVNFVKVNCDDELDLATTYLRADWFDGRRGGIAVLSFGRAGIVG